MFNYIIQQAWKLTCLSTFCSSIVFGLIFWKQESLLYFPKLSGLPRHLSSNPKGYRNPSEYKVPYSSHIIKTSDGVSIHAWFIYHSSYRPADGQSLPTIIFFHGNAGNIGMRLPNAIQMYQHLRANILLVEYRGFGDSPDDNYLNDSKIAVRPTERGLKLDAEAALRFLKDELKNEGKVDTRKLFVFGRSLGGAVALHLAHYAEHTLGEPLAGVIVENTFLSISKMVDSIFPILTPFKRVLLRIGWDNSSIINKLRKTPILFLAGDDDEIVPHSHMISLHRSSIQARSSSTSSISSADEGCNVSLHIVKGGRHNDTWVSGGKAYWDAIGFFILRFLTGDELSNETKRSSSLSGVEVDMGSEALSQSSLSLPTEDVSETKDDVKTFTTRSSIPIMPSGIMGMAREATKSSTVSVGGNSYHAPDTKKKD